MSLLFTSQILLNGNFPITLIRGKVFIDVVMIRGCRKPTASTIYITTLT